MASVLDSEFDAWFAGIEREARSNDWAAYWLGLEAARGALDGACDSQ